MASISETKSTEPSDTISPKPTTVQFPGSFEISLWDKLPKIVEYSKRGQLVVTALRNFVINHGNLVKQFGKGIQKNKKAFLQDLKLAQQICKPDEHPDGGDYSTVMLAMTSITEVLD